MRVLFAARHAPAALRSGVCAGRLDLKVAVPPECAFRALAAAAPRLKAICQVWTSPLSRCAELADRAAAALGVACRRDDRLLELSYGLWEGRAWAEIERADPLRFRTWLARWETEGCPGGESAGDVEARVRSWWEGLPEGAHVLIGHAGALRALQVIARGARWADAMAAPVPHLKWIRFEGQ